MQKIRYFGMLNPKWSIHVIFLYSRLRQKNHESEVADLQRNSISYTQSRYTYELTALVTACTRPVYVQVRQNPSLEERK